MNVLLIAPEFGLAGVMDEVRSVSTLLRAVTLTGTVTRRDVLDTLNGHAWDVIWFACHSDESGVALSDGVMPTSDLTAIVRNSSAHLVVLNSCKSRFVGLEVHYELGVSVVCAEADVHDVTAYQMGAMLARNLAQGLPVEESFERARPGQKASFYLFSAKTRDVDKDERTIQMLNEWGSRLNRQIGELDQRLGEVDQRLSREIAGLREEVNCLARQIAQSVKLTPTHQNAFSLAFAMLAIPVPLFYVQVRDLLGVSWYAALAVAFGCYAISMALWRYMWWGGK